MTNERRFAQPSRCARPPHPSLLRNDTFPRKGRRGAPAIEMGDEGRIAARLKGCNRGVTVTADLATVFTTASHNVAYDIVGAAKTGALESSARRAPCEAPAR